ncbi:unnamed protein product [Microthlaspi erraticum]|uniref:Uncharacterized protein n=1 Tax=Microthlaspi erraticum TaxID=1685480 RepID=A0A6D2JKM6_9BRAS|nr:unnamed protein product [Microthlaspi erraticum]
MTVKDESASSSNIMYPEGIMAVEYEFLKEHHETLEKDYQRIQDNIKHVVETSEIWKDYIQSRTEELGVVTSKLMLDECEREREARRRKCLREKKKKKKMLEEMMATVSQRKAKIDKLIKTRCQNKSM